MSLLDAVVEWEIGSSAERRRRSSIAWEDRAESIILGNASDISKFLSLSGKRIEKEDYHL